VSTGMVAWRCVFPHALTVCVSIFMLAEIMRPGSSMSRGSRRLTRCYIKVPPSICKARDVEAWRASRKEIWLKGSLANCSLERAMMFRRWRCLVLCDLCQPTHQQSRRLPHNDRRLPRPQFPIGSWGRGLSNNGDFQERNHRVYL
jgi:hypothetical protein